MRRPRVERRTDQRQNIVNLWPLGLQSRGIPVLLTTHLLDEADALCSRIGILRAGHMIAEGTPEELRKHVQQRKSQWFNHPKLNV